MCARMCVCAVCVCADVIIGCRYSINYTRYVLIGL